MVTGNGLKSTPTLQQDKQSEEKISTKLPGQAFVAYLNVYRNIMIDQTATKQTATSLLMMRNCEKKCELVVHMKRN